MSLSKKVHIKFATGKLKGTYFNLVKSGIFLQETLHPLTLKYKYYIKHYMAVSIWIVKSL